MIAETVGALSSNSEGGDMVHLDRMLPIRKIDPYTVALTSYYGKTFVSVNQKKTNNSLRWIINNINKASMSEDSLIKEIAPAMVFDNNFKAPYIYSALSTSFKGFKIDDLNFNFDRSDRTNIVSKELLDLLEINGSIVAGKTDKNEPIIIDNNSLFFKYSKQLLIPLGDIYDVLHLTKLDSPIDYSEIRIFSKTIPIGIVLSYFIGFRKLIKLLNAKYRIVEGRKNKQLDKNEYVISFRDISYVFSRDDGYNSLILAGFLEYEKTIKQYESNMFDRKDIYLNILGNKGLSSLYIRELNSTNQLFVDAITKDILIAMNEPVTFMGLLIRATELLMTYYHPDSQDMDHMRIKGYERIAGSIYKELTTAVRQFRNKNISGKSKVDISPYQIWQSIMKDPSIKLVEDINPIQNLKESEIVTYVGEGGRSKESMNKSSRAYHENDLGIVSEATVDSSDVGINTYLSADPNFLNMRGISKKDKNVNPTNIISTSALLAPGSSHDDAKRVELN